MGFTSSEDPLVGPVPVPAETITEDIKSNPDAPKSFLQGQYMAAGYSGHGMPRAFACAEAVAGMVVADMDGTKWDAPEWIPRGYLTNN